MAGPLFTVFTPTYQRADTLHRVRDSLAAQTFRDFEWLIVDDGSTDGTAELVEGWAAEADFPIRLLRQANQGKHIAWNRGVVAAEGELFLGLDSDDACVPHALERLEHHWMGIPDAERGGFSAVSGLCVDQEGHLVGTRFPRDVLDSDPLEVRYRYRVRGEKWGFHRTEVLRANPFPELGGQSHVSEMLVWDRIATRWRTRYVNEALRVYHTDFDADNLMTKTSDAAATSAMFLPVLQEHLAEHVRYARWDPVEFVRIAAIYTRHAMHQGRGPWRQAADLPAAARPFWLAGWPVGAALYLRDRRRT